MRLTPAVFIDKDGTLVENVPYNVDPALITLTPGAGPALRRLKAAGFALILVSNQSGVGLGRFPSSALSAVDARLSELLAPHGVSLDATYYCPHPPGADRQPACACRKPAPGLLFRAAREHRLHLRRSWMVGDILHDIEAGRSAGCRTILIDNGGETEWQRSPSRLPHFTATGWAEAAETILSVHEWPAGRPAPLESPAGKPGSLESGEETPGALQPREETPAAAGRRA